MDGVTRTSFSSTANFEVRSPKLLNVRPQPLCSFPQAKQHAPKFAARSC